ncbi:uncharacterized protein ACIB01_015929 [Guaruba guarouba]
MLFLCLMTAPKPPSVFWGAYALHTKCHIANRADQNVNMSLSPQNNWRCDPIGDRAMMRQFIFRTQTALDEPLGNKKPSINHSASAVEVITAAAPGTGRGLLRGVVAAARQVPAKPSQLPPWAVGFSGWAGSSGDTQSHAKAWEALFLLNSLLCWSRDCSLGAFTQGRHLTACNGVVCLQKAALQGEFSGNGCGARLARLLSLCFSLLYHSFSLKIQMQRGIFPSPKPICIWSSKVWQQAGLNAELGADYNSHEVLSDAGMVVCHLHPQAGHLLPPNTAGDGTSIPAPLRDPSLQPNASGWTLHLLFRNHLAEEKQLMTTSHSHVQPPVNGFLPWWNRILWDCHK